MDGNSIRDDTQVRMSFSAATEIDEKPASRRGKIVHVPALPRALPISDTFLQQELPFVSPSPHVYVHEGVRQQLVRRLSVSLGAPVVLQITDNRHRMFTAKRKGKLYRLRLHHMFLDADRGVLRALARFIQHADRRSSVLLDRFIEASSHKIRKTPRRRKPIVLEWKGKVHNLKTIYDDLNRSYFKGRLECAVTWGRSSRGQRRSSIKMGGYSYDYPLIRIHPALDQPFVPRYFVASILYHEMCHAFLHATEGKDESYRHDAKLHDLERRFPHHERAEAWQAKNLARLLRY